ncbi:MAG: hypothetical protein ABI986_07295, partial [Chloroflexota bacterium]
CVLVDESVEHENWIIFDLQFPILGGTYMTVALCLPESHTISMNIILDLLIKSFLPRITRISTDN